MTFQFIPGAPDDITQITDAAALQHYAEHADPRAFEVLTRRYGAMVLATCRRVLGATADAEDAVQETFLRLARNAGQVRSNVAAWLHACALRISIDQQRKAAAQRRAEGRAQPRDLPDGDARATWRELEPMIDEALSRLDDADRDLIVSRFLVGRSQAEMAAEAGVNPGTIHRRIDAALDQLRTHLRAGGCVVGAAAFAAALQHAPATAQAAPALAGALGKVGLSQVAGCSAPAAASAAGAPGTLGVWLAAAAGVMLTAGAGTLLLTQSGPPVPPTAPAPLAPPAAASAGAAPSTQSVLAGTGSSFPRPTRTIEGFHLRELYTEAPTIPRIHFDGARMYFGSGWKAGKAEHLMTFDIQSISPDAKPKVMRLYGASAKGELGDGARQLLGRTLDVEYAVTGRTLMVKGPFNDGKIVESYACRVVAGSSLDHPGKAEGNHADLAGVWTVMDTMSLKLTGDEILIHITGMDVPIERYRIMEWTEAEGYSKVQAMCTAFAPARGMIGKKFKMLIRKEEKAYSILSYSHETDKRDTYPEKFEFVPDKGLHAGVFRKD